MRNKILRISLLLGSIILTFSGISIAIASPSDIPQNVSIYSPKRPDIPYVEDALGLLYPSFNNFIDNPNVPVDGPRKGTEKKFLVGKYCPQGTCVIAKDNPNDPNAYTYNTIPDTINGPAIKEGDKIKFEIYYHNNGDDQYNKGSTGSPDALNVSIGVDLNNIQDPNNKYLLKPVGFISADNNEYRWNQDDPATVIKNSEEQIIRTATDDMQLVLGEDNLYLEFIPNATRLVIKDVNGDISFDIPQAGTSFTFKSVTDPATKENLVLHAKEIYSPNKMYINFDRIPGCFRYSGAAYFEATVKKTPTPTPNPCTELKILDAYSSNIDTPVSTNFCSIDKKAVQFKVDVDFKDQATEPEEQYVKFTTTDPKAKLSLQFSQTYDPAEFNKPYKLTKPYKLANVNWTLNGWYEGVGDLKAIYTDKNGFPIEKEKPQSSYYVDIPSSVSSPYCEAATKTCPNQCKTICVTSPLDIQEGTYSELSAKTFDYYSDPWTQKITFSVQSNNGKFYTKQDYNGDKTIDDKDIVFKIKQDFKNSNPQKNISTYNKDCFSQPINLSNVENILNLLGKTLRNTATYQYTTEIQFTKQPAELPSKYFKKDVFLALNPEPIQSKTIDQNITTKLSTGTTKSLGSDTSDTLPEEAGLPKVIYNPPVTVSQNETVWFYADKEGKGVIKVTDAVDPTNANCIKTLDISGAPICGDFTIKATQFKDPSKTVDCLSQIQGNTIKLEVTSVIDDKGNIVDLKSHSVEIEWSSTDPNGKFFIPSLNLKNSNPLPLFTSTETVVAYKGKGPISAKVISIDGIVKTNLCAWTLSVCDKCGSLSLKFKEDGTESFVGEGSKNLELNVTKAGTENTKNTQYPSTVKWTDNTGGTLIFPPGTQVTKTFQTITDKGVEKLITMYTTLYPYPATGSFLYFGAQTPGTIKAEVVGEEAVCSGSLTVSNPVCQSLTYKIAKADGTALTDNLSELGTKDIYLITPQAAYLPPNVKKDILIDYNASKIDQGKIVDYGYFALAKEVKISGVTITIPETDLGKWKSLLPSIPVGESVFFIPSQKLQPGKYTNVISIKVVGATGASEAGCAKTLSILVEKNPEICTAIGLKTDPSPFNPTTTLTKITINPATSKFGDLADTAQFEFKITKGADQADLYSTNDPKASGANFLYANKSQAISSGIYIKAVPIATDVEVTVRLLDPAQPLCTKPVEFKSKPVACQSITLNSDPSSMKPGSDANFTTLWINGTFGDYKGTFTFKVEDGSSKLYLSSNLTPHQTLTVPFDWATGTPKTVLLIGPDEKTRVSVTAADEQPTLCIDDLLYTPQIKPVDCEDLELIDPANNLWDFEDEGETVPFRVKITPANQNWKVHWSTNGDGNFDKSETSISSSGISENTLENTDLDTRTEIYVVGYKGTQCEINPYPKSEKVVEEPTFTKKVAKASLEKALQSSTKWSDIINIAGFDGTKSKDPYVTYRLDFYPGNNVDSVRIWETEFDGGSGTSAYIKGSKNGQLIFNKLEINIDGDTLSSEDENSDLICNKSTKNSEPCVTIEDWNGKDEISMEDIIDTFTQNHYLLFKNIEDTDRILIYYEMKNKTAVNGLNCREKFKPEDGCGETFINTASYKADGYHRSKSTTVIALCPYILTRSGGDTFFNSELETGVDVAYCGEQKSIQGPVIIGIKEKEIEVIKVGKDTTPPPQTSYLNHPTHDICKYSNTDEEGIPEYQNALKSFSSTICEMKAEVSEDWTKVNVVNQIKTNIDKLSRWTEEGQNIDLNAPPTMSKGIYKVTGKKLTINGNGGTFTIGEKSSLAPAGQTYIVENADLYINSNIEYAQVGYSLPNSVPSAAFVVINGNIHIGKDITRLDGTYIAISTDDAHKDKGKVIAEGDPSDKPLTINGSLIGDVFDLFSNRTYVGNIAEDQGAVVIKYSENFLINTPPGLSQLMDVTQLKSVY